RHAAEGFDAAADVREAGPPVRGLDELVDEAVRQVVRQLAEARLALPQRVLYMLALGHLPPEGLVDPRQLGGPLPDAPFERLLGLLVLGEVAGDLREPGEPARRVAQGREDDVGPEAGAVLADAPALVFRAPVPGGLLQLPGRLAGRYVLRRVKAGEVLAD